MADIHINVNYFGVTTGDIFGLYFIFNNDRLKI